MVHGAIQWPVDFDFSLTSAQGITGTSAVGSFEGLGIKSGDRLDIGKEFVVH